jgi:inorganic pyrophosphatase
LRAHLEGNPLEDGNDTAVDGDRFWQGLDELVSSCTIVVDRPRGSRHPRYRDSVYPMDYGYLQGTHAADGGGIDVWIGSLLAKEPTALIVTIDLVKRDSEVKILLGCTREEMAALLRFHNDGLQSAMLVGR